MKVWTPKIYIGTTNDELCVCVSSGCPFLSYLLNFDWNVEAILNIHNNFQ